MRGGGLCCLAAVLIACGSTGPGRRPVASLPTLQRAADEANADLREGVGWRPLETTRVVGLTFESYRYGPRGPRLVFIRRPGAAVSVQTWVSHQHRADALSSPRLPEAAAEALRAAAESHPRRLAVRVGLDRSHVNVRTIADPERLFAHIEAHADLLCRPSWPTPLLERAGRRAVRPEGWAHVSTLLSRTAWTARYPSAATEPGEDVLTTDAAATALSAWLRPSAAVVVVTGDVSRREALTTAGAAFRNCQGQPDTDRLLPDPAGVGLRLSVEVPGPFRHVLANWVLPRLPPRGVAAIDGLALALSDDTVSPLARALIPDHAVGVAVRHRHHTGGADLDVVMTLAPTTTTSAAVSQARGVLFRLADRLDPAVMRAVAGLRNLTLRRLSILEGPGAIAAEALLSGGTLSELGRRLKSRTELEEKQVRRLVSEHLLIQPPLIVLGRPQGRAR